MHPFAISNEGKFKLWHLKYIIAATGGAVFLVGVSVLWGWVIDSSVLKTVYPGLVTMKANTAFCLLLSGSALALLSRDRLGVFPSVMVAVSASMVFLLGSVVLGEYFFNWNAGIDELLFPDTTPSPDTSRPGLMAPSTAFCFILTGLALWAAFRRNSNKLAVTIQSALAATLIGIGGAATIGQLSNAIFHFHLWNYFWMALHTAFSLVLLGVGLLAHARQMDGFNWALDKSTSFVFATAILGMLIAACVTWDYANELKDAAFWVNHTNQVLKDIEEVRASVANMESSQRGFVILGDESLLDRRQQATIAARNSIQELRSLTADNSVQKPNLDELEKLVAQRTDLGDQAISIRRREGFTPAPEWIAAGEGIRISAQIEKTLSVMRDEEYRLLAIRQTKSEAVSSSTFLLQPLCIFLSLTILFLALFVLNTGLYERWLAAEASARLAAIVDSSRDAIIGKDLNSIVTSWNKGAEMIFGYSASEMIGRSITQLIPAERLQEEDDLISRVRKGESIEHIDTVRMAKDGHLIDSSMTVSPIDRSLSSERQRSHATSLQVR